VCQNIPLYIITVLSGKGCEKKLIFLLAYNRLHIGVCNNIGINNENQEIFKWMQSSLNLPMFLYFPFSHLSGIHSLRESSS
jgi:hypothetical protein